MLVHIPYVLAEDQLMAFRDQLDDADWRDGRMTAGPQSALVKSNLQLGHDDATAITLGEQALRALERNELFISAALPQHVFPPLFNRYGAGMGFGNHVDNAIRQSPGTAQRLRTDLSATLFLNAPEDYDGGELLIEDTYGAHSVKLAAGDMIVYPATSLHRVLPITRGERQVAVFWIQSLVRDVGCRTLLFEMDGAIRDLVRSAQDNDPVIRLTSCYHNLLRRWAEV